MEKISDILPSIFPNSEKTPHKDEYIKDGLIWCKKCNTPRQQIFDFNGKKDVWYVNCKCRQAEIDAEEEAEKKAKWQARINYLRRIGIPNITYQNYTFSMDDGKTPEITKVCKNYVAKFSEVLQKGGGLIFWGNVGTGKTFLAMCIANALIDKGYQVKCTTLAAVVKKAQDFDNADKYFRDFMRNDLIIIDDLGVERGTTFANEQIYLFIDGCNTNNIPIIFTTNHTPKQLSAASEDTSDLTFARIYSRILEKCLPIKVNDIKRRAENEKK